MINNIENIINEEVINHFNEGDLNFNDGTVYQPQGLNPEIVRLFEDDVEIIDETYKSVNEIHELAGDIIMKSAEQNAENYNKNKAFDYFYGINLKIIDSTKYDEIASFVKDTNLNIFFVPYDNNKLGVKGSYSYYREDMYDPKSEKDITIYYDFYSLRDDINSYINEWGEITTRDLYIKVYDKIKSSLIHELQHAFDDYRSKNKIYQTIENRNYMLNQIKNAQVKDFKTVKQYLNLPHEIWARFSDTVNQIYFYGFDIIEEKNELLFFMYPMHKVIKDFGRNFSGYRLLSEKMKRKLIRKIAQFWHYEEEKIPERNLNLNKK